MEIATVPRGPDGVCVVVADHLDQADRIARAFAAQYRGLIEQDDAVQTARLALVRLARRLDSTHPGRWQLVAMTVRGSLRHYLRDHARMVRVSRREHEKGVHPLGHVSLQELTRGGRPLLEQLQSPEALVPADEEGWLEELLDQLPAGDAALLRLRYLEGRTLREIAAELGQSLSATCRAERRGLAALREQLEP